MPNSWWHEIGMTAQEARTTMVGSTRQERRARRDRVRLLGGDGELRLTGHIGSQQRAAYLRALGDDVTKGRCSDEEAVVELEQLSSNWLRGMVQWRLRRLPPRADGHLIEHRMWQEWHASLGRFDPHRVETFPGYVAIRLRMAIAAAVREEDDSPGRGRARTPEWPRRAESMVGVLGRPLHEAEERALTRAVWQGPLDAVAQRVHAGYRHDATPAAPPTHTAAPDPADTVNTATTLL